MTANIDLIQAVSHPSLSYLAARTKLQIQKWPDALVQEGFSESLCLRTRETEVHTFNATELTVLLARMASIPENEINFVRYGALLHDLGKLGIPEGILLKPAKLSNDEWGVIHDHPRLAYELMYPTEYLRPCVSIPYCHHEKWDGTGYPQGLKGEDIPLPARLFAIVDACDMLSSDRAYGKAWSQEKVMDYINQQAGRQFDPWAVELFFFAINELAHISE